jgi:hypothetical protein
LCSKMPKKKKISRRHMGFLTLGVDKVVEQSASSGYR